MKTPASQSLDKAIYVLTLCYALVSCWELNITPATFVSAGLILIAVRHYFSPIDIQLDAPIKWAIGLYWAALFLSVAAAYPGVRLSQAWSVIDRMLTLPLVLYCCRTKRQLLLLVAGVALSLAVADLTAILQFWQNPAQRVSSVFAHPVHFGEHLLLASSFILPLALLPVADCSRSLKLFLLATLGLSIPAALFNQTRAVWVAAGLIGAFYVLLQGKNNRRVLTGALLVCCFIGIWIDSSPILYNRLISVQDSSFQSNAERLRIWQSACTMIADYPVLGVGPNNFGEKYQARYILPTALEREQRDAHSTYLSTAAELGLVGLGTLLYMILVLLTTFAYSRRNAREPAWSLAGLFVLLAFSIYGTMNSMINTFWAMRLFWLLIGAALAGNRITNSEAPKPSE